MFGMSNGGIEFGSVHFSWEVIIWVSLGVRKLPETVIMVFSVSGRGALRTSFRQSRNMFWRCNHLSFHMTNFRGSSSQMMALNQEPFLKPVCSVVVLNWIRICTCVDFMFCIIASAWAVRSQGPPTSCVLQRPSRIALNYKLSLLFIHVLWPCMASFQKWIKEPPAE